jgi:hypothetical protein
MSANTAVYGRTVCNNDKTRASEVNSRNSQSCKFAVDIVTMSSFRTTLEHSFLDCVTFMLRILKKKTACLFLC